MEKTHLQETAVPIQRFLLVAVQSEESMISAQDSLTELEELLRTAGGEAIGRVIQNRELPHPKTYLGTGKIQEVLEQLDDTGADGVVIDDELSPVQQKSLTDLLKVKVIDRTLLILDIFTQRASTREGMLQVELAQLNYRLTRLAGLGTELSRQGGSVGVAHSRGAGESKLELDRRYIRRRIDQLNRQLKEVEQQRGLLRSQRVKNEIPVVALVGYTNAGKSALFNRLTQAEVLEEDKLFATLDTTLRRCQLPGGRQILLSDTVGFIHKLPHHLVKAFRATLEEALYADILLHVVDDSDEKAEMQMEVTYQTLQDLKAADKPILTLLNKQDKKDPTQDTHRVPYSAEKLLKISAFSAEDRQRVLEAIEEILQKQEEELEVLLPYGEGRLADVLHRNGQILAEEYREEGVYLKVRIKTKYAEMVRQYKI